MSRMLRAKKFMASKLSDSAAGRKVIIKFLGPAGDRMLTALDSAIVKHSGRAVAKTMRLHIFKLATKIGVLMQNQTLLEEHMEPAREPSQNMVEALLAVLEAPVESRDYADLVQKVMVMHDAVYAIISPHMKEANAKRLTELLNFLSSTSFLDAFTRGADYETERDEILKNVKRLSRPIETEAPATTEFQKERLQQRRNLLAQLLASPQFDDYLRYEDTGKAVREWLVQQNAEFTNHINFLHAVGDFKQINARNLLSARATTIYDKHFSSTASAPLPIADDVVSAIQNHFDEDTIRKDMFDAALQRINEILKAAFESGFRESEQYMDLQHELEMIDFKLQTQFQVAIEGAEDLNLAELDDDELDVEDDDGEEETKG